MVDDNKIEPVKPLEPVKTLVTRRAETADDVAATNAQPDGVTIVARPAWMIMLVRTARVYLQTLVGILLAGGTGVAGAVGVNLPMHDFVSLFWSAAGLSLAPAAITLIQNAIELLAKLDVTAPTLRG